MPKAKTKRKPSVSIVGPGRLGQALAIALHSSGYPIKALVGRPSAQSPDELDQLPASDLILITTPDDAIEDTARRLAAFAIGRTHRPTVLHTSGALSSEILSPLRENGFHIGSLHPLVSVSEPRGGAEALRGAFYCLEGDKLAMKLAGKIVSDLDGTSFSIQPENKALYHAAAVMASGHLVALIDLATEMLAACGLNKKSARRILIPLVESTVNNLKLSDTEKALTGTFARGDLATVKRHLSVLRRNELIAPLEVYKLLGLHSLQLAEKNGLDPQLLEQIKKLLDSTMCQPDASEES